MFVKTFLYEIAGKEMKQNVDEDQDHDYQYNLDYKVLKD